MPNWREMRVAGLGPIDRVVAVFQVGPPLERVPFPSFKVKVLERANGSFLAVPNVAALGPDGHPSWEAGLGDTSEEALEDALRRFVRILDERKPASEADFAWADPEEF
jgi:hypothetical protein